MLKSKYILWKRREEAEKIRIIVILRKGEVK